MKRLLNRKGLLLALGIVLVLLAAVVPLPRLGPGDPPARDDGGGAAAADPCTLEEQLEDAPPTLHAVRLRQVYNASGMVLLRDGGRRRVATANDNRTTTPVPPQWTKRGYPTPFPAITISDPETGAYISHSGRAGVPAETEALALREGALVRLVTPRGGAALVEGERVVTLEVKAVTHKLPEPIQEVVFEGLARAPEGWVTVMTAARGEAQSEAQAEQYTLYLVTFADDGTLAGMAGPVRFGDGRLLHDFGGALDRLPSGNLILPGFFVRRVVIVDPRGIVLHELPLEVDRVEGVAWDGERCELLLVRECDGGGGQCNNSSVAGPPLWIARFRAP